MLMYPLHLMHSVYHVSKLYKQFYVPPKITMACTHKHVNWKEKSIAFLKYKCHELNYSQSNPTLIIKGMDGNVCNASYKVSCHTAHCREVHMIPNKSDHTLCIRYNLMCAL
jgi:hypothetical protein